MVLEKIVRIPTEEEYGGFNDPFPNMREVTEADLASSMYFTYPPKFWGYKQIAPNRLPAGIEPVRGFGMLAVHYYVFHDGSGYGMCPDPFQKKMRYFFFSKCEHEYKHTSPRMCQHVMTCMKCGYQYSYGSD